MDTTKVAADGGPIDAGGHDYATPFTLARFKDASETLAHFKAPAFLHAGDASDRLFFVAFDGTGNNKFTDPEHATNVAQIHDELERAAKRDPRLFVQYIEGPGTVGTTLERGYDSATGASFEANVESAYKSLVKQANEWRETSPKSHIHVQSIGFSRGASQAAYFTNVLHERGIPDLSSEQVSPDGERTYARHLVEPGKTPQSVGLFDPVATGHPMKFDRRLPPSVVSGLQITAENELRATFPSDQIIAPGMSEDGRFLNISVPGAHSDVGGGYLRNGLSIRCGNLMRDYCNAFDEEPKLAKQFEPADQRFNVVHRSSEGQTIFRMDPRAGIRGEITGTNEHLAPRMPDGTDAPPHKASEPPVLKTEPRNIVIGPANTTPEMHGDARVLTAAEKRVAGAGPSLKPVIGLAATIPTLVDAAETSRNALGAFESSNMTAFDSHILHFAGRNAGGWAGAATFAMAAGAAGIETGPGAVVIAGIGGVVGGMAGEHLANEYDLHKINNQKAPDGQTWTLDPALGWSRKLPPLPESPQGQVITASPELSRRLTFQANNTATELALATTYKPQDPYRQPANAHDTPTADGAPWVRDAGTRQWSRHITDQVLEHGMTRSHVEHATPQRTAELEESAMDTIRENVAQSHLGIAERYVSAYDSEGWKDMGKIPTAVQHALVEPTHQLRGSDGDTYEHELAGNWKSPGLFRDSVAKGNLRDELDRTEQVTNETSGKITETLASMDAEDAKARGPLLLDDPSHPDHAMYTQARGHMADLDKSLGRTPDQYTNNMASALTVQARRDGLSRIDQIALSDDGQTLWAVQTPPGRKDHLFDLQTKVPTAEAMTPMDQSAAKWPEAMQQFQSIEQQANLDRQQSLERQQQQQESMGHGRSM
jgi:hypothetical protein